MHIEELGKGDLGCWLEEKSSSPDDDLGGGIVVASGAKRVLVGAGARILFYPTLLYNVLRNKFQAEFRWWDRVDQFVLLGAVPFPTDVLRLKDLGVCGVITLNEPYETLVPTSLYHAHGIHHLVIPTRDYLFAPSMSDICQAVDFIHENALCGHTTYVHCKAGRGRSTTIVMCYLVKYKQMSPDTAFKYLRSIRPRVLLASAQWQAVQEFYHLKVKKLVVNNHFTYHFKLKRSNVDNHFTYHLKVNKPRVDNHFTGLCVKNPTYSVAKDLFTFYGASSVAKDPVAFDDGSMVVVTESDLDGYEPIHEMDGVGSEIWADPVYRVRVVSGAALARISCLWLRCRAPQISREKLSSKSSCSIKANYLGGIGVEIPVC